MVHQTSNMQRGAEKLNPIGLEAVLARWLDGETLDLTGELRKAAAEARGADMDPPKLTHWSFLADF